MEWKNASSESLQSCLVRKLERKSGKFLLNFYLIFNWPLLTTRKVWLFKCFQGSGKIPVTKAQSYAHVLMQYSENSLLVLIYFKL
jgi:hypothetical protein